MKDSRKRPKNPQVGGQPPQVWQALCQRYPAIRSESDGAVAVRHIVRRGGACIVLHMMPQDVLDRFLGCNNQRGLITHKLLFADLWAAVCAAGEEVDSTSAGGFGAGAVARKVVSFGFPRSGFLFRGARPYALSLLPWMASAERGLSTKRLR